MPAGLHGGDDDNAVLPPLWDRGSRQRSIVVVVVIVALGIPSRCLPDRRIDDDANDAGDDGDDGNNMGMAAG